MVLILFVLFTLYYFVASGCKATFIRSCLVSCYCSCSVLFSFAEACVGCLSRRLVISAATWEVHLSDTCAHWRLKTSCASTQLDRSLCWSYEKNFASLAIRNAPSEDWLDCANAQADPNLCWAHMSEGTFLTYCLVYSWCGYSCSFALPVGIGGSLRPAIIVHQLPEFLYWFATRTKPLFIPLK